MLEEQDSDLGFEIEVNEIPKKTNLSIQEQQEINDRIFLQEQFG